MDATLGIGVDVHDSETCTLHVQPLTCTPELPTYAIMLPMPQTFASGTPCVPSQAWSSQVWPGMLICDSVHNGIGQCNLI